MMRRLWFVAIIFATASCFGEGAIFASRSASPSTFSQAAVEGTLYKFQP